jgi:hypothetical protein
MVWSDASFSLDKTDRSAVLSNTAGCYPKTKRKNSGSHIHGSQHDHINTGR